ncbi:30S ribosomal protein S6 [Paenactinomyces guangxiensis]|uniref:Small ribosomal subunit protein bS6 n=1 Tax=Paenactinomyces guangxiensis TaxID=1490290 RepID=A0A7W1WQ91_9BACL|nr:30S ribosomal protein S6 [Paenactinomyces guangxiensis]MBA4494094.1 30S ribosomal protein S6 [Paenactinomyces guangxiensis]MBH8591161.1 30S ribosomal protein S6 [Paenactinomyces guangxiensis]
MHKYELMFIIRPDVDEDTIKATRDKVQSVITENGGEIIDTNDMGKRRLAYLIDKYREGIYTVYTFQAKADVVTELDRVININDNIIRHLVININEK